MSTKPLAKQVVPGANGAESANAQDGAIRRRDSLFRWCGTADSVRQTAKRAGKCALLEAYFASVAEESIAPAARLFAGIVFPRPDERTIRVDWSVVADAIQDLTRISPTDLRARHAKHGSLGDAAADAFAGRLPSGLSVTDFARWADDLAAAGNRDERRVLVREMLARLSGLEARYVATLLDGELSLGLKEAHVEEALAKAFAQPLAAVRRANRQRGDIGEVARLARQRTLDDRRGRARPQASEVG